MAKYKKWQSASAGMPSTLQGIGQLNNGEQTTGRDCSTTSSSSRLTHPSRRLIGRRPRFGGFLHFLHCPPIYIIGVVASVLRLLRTGSSLPPRIGLRSLYLKRSSFRLFSSFSLTNQQLLKAVYVCMQTAVLYGCARESQGNSQRGVTRRAVTVVVRPSSS